MDSEASFEDRARQIGVSLDGIAALKRRSLNTIGKFAFLSAYQPGSADEGPLVTALEEVLGARPDAANMASWRRLFFESLKARLERKGEEEPRRLLMPERVEKLRLAKQELAGRHDRCSFRARA